MNSVKLEEVILIYRNILLFYTIIGSYQKEKEQFCLKIASKRIKYLGISLTKEMKDLSSGKYETFIKVIEDDTKKWKDIPCF